MDDTPLKLIKKFLEKPNRITFNECERLLKSLGYSKRKKRGSDQAFHKPGSYPISVPIPKKGRYVKSPYIKIIINLLGLEKYIEES